MNDLFENIIFGEPVRLSKRPALDILNSNLKRANHCLKLVVSTYKENTAIRNFQKTNGELAAAKQVEKFRLRDYRKIRKLHAIIEDLEFSLKVLNVRADKKQKVIDPLLSGNIKQRDFSGGKKISKKPIPQQKIKNDLGTI